MDYKPLVLRKLFRRRIIGGKHTAFEHAMTGVPGHALGDVKKAAEELIKNGFIIAKKTSYGLQISLDPERLEEIEQIIANQSTGEGASETLV